MALTATQQAWVENDNLRAVLVEAAYNKDTVPLNCNNGNTLPALADLPDILCNNGNTTSGLPPIYCNSTGISTGEEVIYLSNTPYVTAYNDTFTNVIGSTVHDISYEDALKTLPAITSTIESSTSIGSISFYNTSGEYDYLVEKAFEGHRIKVLIGDITWSRTDFITAFNGRISQFTAPDISSLSFSIRDKKEILEKTKEDALITSDLVSSVLNSATQFEATVDGVPTSAIPNYPWASIAFNPATKSIPDATLNTRVPVCVGKCFNVEPVLIDAYNHVFMIHNGEITAVTDVKSNGVLLDPSQYEVDTGIGCIRLLDHQLTTLITADVEGAANRGTGYDDAVENTLTKNSVPWIIEWLVLEKTELLKSDIDYASFVAVDGTNSSAVGLFYRSEDNILSLMTQVTNSIGSFYRFNRLGLLELTILEDPATLDPPTVTIINEDIEQNGLELASVELPTNQVNLGYRKNWTVLSKGNIAGILEEVEGLETREKLTTEYSIVSKVNVEVKAAYPLAEISDTIETVLYDTTPAQTEVDRRANIRKDKRYIYRLKGVRPMLDVDVGDAITIIHDRFGFTGSGKQAIIISLSERLTKNRVDIEAWL